VMQATEALGGIDYSMKIAEEFAQAALDAIEKLPESGARTALVEAVSYAIERRQ